MVVNRYVGEETALDSVLALNSIKRNPELSVPVQKAIYT